MYQSRKAVMNAPAVIAVVVGRKRTRRCGDDPPLAR
jgi:hypothetical protein